MICFWGKTFATFLGFMLIDGNPFAILLGIFFGHIFDRAVVNYFNENSVLCINTLSHQERQECFFYSTFSVMGHIAKTKDQVTPADIQVANVYLDQMPLQGQTSIDCEYNLLNALQTAKHRMQVVSTFAVANDSCLLNSLQTTKHRMQAHSAFSAGKDKDFSLLQTLSEFVHMAGEDRNVLQMFLGIQIKMAYTDGLIHSEKRETLYNIAEHLGFSSFELNRLLRMIAGQHHFHQENQQEESEDDSYKILGIKNKASDKEVKRAYRKLMSQYHPDKFASKGLPKEMMQLTKEKTQYIQRAYETLCKSQGLK
ncbi:co-chaperone DjlA [Psychromonas antarctica]|uniref:co-chaperone DjlA n=1 Tax=Psychromonas antarctica TaxID=67573 RepID=UPI001EE93D42|nr:co-chaperone DjlA [Psychromonas antarctica]MCG6201224.1 co-chaperone DjlA [Psychromonas antarctica]